MSPLEHNKQWKVAPTKGCLDAINILAFGPMHMPGRNWSWWTRRLAAALILTLFSVAAAGVSMRATWYESPIPVPAIKAPAGRTQTRFPFVVDSVQPASPPVTISTVLDRTAPVIRYLIDAGLGETEAARWGDLFARIAHSRQMASGHALTLFKDPDTGALRGFRYNLDYRATVTELGLGAGIVRIWRQPIQYVIRPIGVSFRVNNDFQDAATANGVPNQIVKTLDQAFASRYPLSQIRPGTTVKLIYQEKVSRDGTWRLPTGLEAARLDLLNGSTLDAFAFSEGHTGAHLYDAQGQSLGIQTLRFPVEFKYISSGFTYSRYHPILHIYRPHLGVDLATDYGAPVKAIGDGLVSQAGWCGELGRCVRIEHPGDMASIYGHLSEVNVSPGSTVQVGQLIGRVGSSGLSTGAHLHFAIEKGDRFVNPLTERFGITHDISPDMRVMFAKIKAKYEVALSRLPEFGSHVGPARVAEESTTGSDSDAGIHYGHHRYRRWHASRATVVDYEGGM